MTAPITSSRAAGSASSSTAGWPSAAAWSRLAAWSYGYGFRRLAEEHTLYIVQRRRGLPGPHRTREMAADQAQLLGQHFGRVRLMGLSTGGLIAQHVVLDYPNLWNASCSS